jgi:hypothetical protein
MSATRNSKPRRTSKKSVPHYTLAPVLLTGLIAALVSAAAIWFFYRDGSLMNFGDAESHLNTARRVFDSITPGWDQLGTPWLPFPHLLMIPFVRSDHLWRTGLAGSIPSAACFVAAAMFLFAAVRRIFQNLSSPVLAAGLFVLNPNALFLQSAPMTEPVFFFCLFGLLYFCVLFQETQSMGAVVGAGIMACCGTLTRYDGWFLLPFAALFFLLAARQNRVWTAVLFSILAGLGPILWLGFNWWVFGNPLAFFNGPSSAAAIQRGLDYPGKHDWSMALKYYHAAADLALGTPLFWIALAGIAACAVQFKRSLWPALLFALPPVFYVLSIHSSDIPIHVPQLPPNSWYNTRYGLALLPLGALGGAAIAGVMPQAFRFLTALALLVVCAGQWLLFPRPPSWITWREAQVNSEARRDWTNQAAVYLEANYKRGETIATSFGDITAIYRRLGIPLRRTVTIDNSMFYLVTMHRPDLFLTETWAVAFAGDKVQTAVDAARLHGFKYELVKEIVVKGAPVLQIYKRPDVRHWKGK